MGHNSSIPKVDDFSQEEVSRLEKRFQKLDVDRSGSISIGEFVSVPRFDSDLDKNKDGFLDEAEIIAWVIPDNNEIATDEVNHLFAGADEDVDGLLSVKEIIDNHELFVGSEATDYGEHLHDPDRFDDEL